MKGSVCCDMKLTVFLWGAALLGAFLPHCLHGRPFDATMPHRLLGPQSPPLQKPLLRGPSLSSASAAVNRGWMQLTQLRPQAQEEAEHGGKEKRSEELPISLDLTFHLLREVLEMARDEQESQQAHNNRLMMDNFGK